MGNSATERGAMWLFPQLRVETNDSIMGLSRVDPLRPIEETDLTSFSPLPDEISHRARWRQEWPESCRRNSLRRDHARDARLGKYGLRYRELAGGMDGLWCPGEDHDGARTKKTSPNPNIGDSKRARRSSVRWPCSTTSGWKATSVPGWPRTRSSFILCSLL